MRTIKNILVVVLMGWVIVNGIRVLLQEGADVSDYHGLVTRATADMMQFQESWGDDAVFAIARRGELYTMRRINGQPEIIMGAVPNPAAPIPQTPMIPEGLGIYPVLGIRLSEKKYPSEAEGDMYQLTRAPDFSQVGFHMNLDEERLYFSFEGGREEHWKLEDISQYDHADSAYEIIRTYEPVADGIIFFHEFAYRDHYVDGVLYELDPVIFTCGDYVPVIPSDQEFYTDIVRAISMTNTYVTDINIGGNGVRHGVNVQNRDYETTYIRDITLPDYFDEGVDPWPEEMQDRSCYPPGDYQLWDRGGSTPVAINGHEYYLEVGVGTIANETFYLNQHNAGLIHEYTYYGPVGNFYHYRFILWVDGEEYVIYEGSRTPDGDMPDDIYSGWIKIFDLNGAPVVVFGYLQFFSSKPDIARYGIYFNKRLDLTEEVEIDAYLQHKVLVPNSVDPTKVYGHGDVIAFGIEKTEDPFEPIMRRINESTAGDTKWIQP